MVGLISLRSFGVCGLAAAFHGLVATSVLPSTILHVHDSGNRLGTVNLQTGAVEVIGHMGGDTMTDIAFTPDGHLFGLSFSDLYQIDPETARATRIGSHGIPGGNALVFGPEGSLFAAGVDSRSLYRVNPANGASVNLGSTGFYSAGDLAFNDGKLFMSSKSDRLIRLLVVGGVSSIDLGPIGFDDVFGLATANDNVLYGSSGTRVLRIDPATGAGTQVLDYAGRGLSQANGTSFIDEAIADLTGDYDVNGIVSQSDMDLVLLNWGDHALPAGWIAADQFDGIQMSQNELDGVLLNWGNGVLPGLSTVPEPSAFLTLVGALSVLGFRGRFEA